MDIEWDKIVESEKIYEFPKNLKENLALFANWMSFMTSQKAKDFYQNNNVKLRTKIAHTDLKWSKGIENKFYEVVQNTFYPNVVIEALNEVTDLNNSTSNKIGPDRATFFKGLNRLEEINHFLNANSYSEPEFKKEILKKSVYCLFNGDLETMKNLTSLMNHNVDTLSIKEVLGKIKPRHTKLSVAEDLNVFNLMEKKTELKKFGQFVPRFCGGITAFGVVIELSKSQRFKDLAQGVANETIEGIKKTIETAQPVTDFIKSHANSDIINTATTSWEKVQHLGINLLHHLPQNYQDPKFLGIVLGLGIIASQAGKYAPKFLVKAVDAFSDQKINMQSVKDFNNRNYLSFFIKKDLLDGIIKKNEYNLSDSSCANHIDLTAFAIAKLDNPALRVEHLKDNSGQALSAKLGLSQVEMDRLNNLTVEEIHSISQVQNVDFRDTMFKNKFTNQELLMIKKIEAQQLISGYGVLKGNFFNVPNENDLDVSLRGLIFSGSPIKTAILSNILKIGAKKEDDKLVLDNNYVNSIQNVSGSDIYKELGNLIKLDISESKTKKALEEKIKETKCNNEETKIKLESVFNSYGVDITEFNKILKSDDKVRVIVKNKTLEVLTKLRGGISSVASRIIP
jgi:hypothetical protein